jgi:hypothetical protein
MKERDETRERFAAAIAEKLDTERIVELHLFHSIKQGAVESGVAVIAVREGPPLAGDEGGSEKEAAEDDTTATPEHGRLAVYTAKYRLTLKGADRGKWEFAIQAEADAPLTTVDKVVRGVQRRSADVVEPERLSGEEFRALLAEGSAGGGRNPSAPSRPQDRINSTTH